uniref:Uncharacterized protein n=1 Tax=Rhizophora mucronata TaxID=61149 RepID=A0A2P2N9Q7_RHIMU
MLYFFGFFFFLKFFFLSFIVVVWLPRKQRGKKKGKKYLRFSVCFRTSMVYGKFLVALVSLLYMQLFGFLDFTFLYFQTVFLSWCL